ALAGEPELVERLTGVRRTGPAAGAPAAGDDALAHARVTGNHAVDALPHRLDDARPLVPERERVAGEGRIDLSPQELEIRSAPTAEDRSDDDLVRPGLQRRTVEQLDRPGTLDDESASRHPA